MKIQVNSDRTIGVDATLVRFVEDEANRALDRFAARVTRVEVHLSDVDGAKTGQVDKSCRVEVRPANERPLAASAQAATTESAVRGALGKMKRSLTTFFGRKGRPAAELAEPVSKARKSVARKATKKVATKKTATKKTAAKKTAMKKPTKLSPRGPKKKGIYQARRKSSSGR